MENNYYSEPQEKLTRDNFSKKTWILLIIVWVLCLIPIPFTGIIAIVMNFAAFVMAIVALAKGYVRSGVLQLLSVCILTPALYTIGILISAALISQTLDTGNLSKQTLQEEFFKGLNDDVGNIYKIQGNEHAPNISTRDISNSSNPKIPLLKPKQPSQEPEKVITWYIAYTKEGGEIDCTDITKDNSTLKLKTKSGMQINIHHRNVLKVERYQTVGNQTKKSVWTPAKG